ncbi:MAG TPA: hypothetical protein VFA43_22185 [Gemmatimonadaceae bacterium]|nr:hypothetical protein [Gemmatimonadaceae bacterium]
MATPEAGTNAREQPTQRFNHVAVTVPADCLDEAGRAAILRFYGDVFGWTEMPTLTRDRELLVLRAHSNEQFVFIQAARDPMRCAGGEHFGLSVATPAELDDLYARARAFRDSDPRAEVTDRTVEDYVAVKLHAFYARYLLPVSVEVQCFEWAPGFSPESLR